MKFTDSKTIIKSLKDKDDEIKNLENYYKDNNTYENLLSSDKQLQGDLSNIKSEINDLYLSLLFENLIEQDRITQKNTIFEENKLKLDKKLQEYIINKDKKNSSTIFKLDIYDRNIEDNLFLIYYFLSYGILGLFIYKLLK
uniref:Uncharacterized protein n=1 Tax=viral metagenome TaxID=1070528 RepID=A0A6C0FA75_9ZZZZ|tara:strand:+ start:15687 stop:16109 length:423 start_codon:yes stop_codon:yes gene_type:complete